MSKLLIDERPLTVLPSLVEVVGMERAVILQQIHWLLQSPNNGIEHDGERWVWGTYEEWCADYFTFWKADTLRKHLVKLEHDGFVVSIQIRGFDRTKHYRINTEKIKEVENAMRHDHAASKRKKFHTPNRHDHAASNREDHAGSKRHDDDATNRDDHATLNRDDHASSYITKTSTETSSKTPTETSSSFFDDEEEVHDPVAAAWRVEYGEEMPEKIGPKIAGLVNECGPGAVIHGIKASAEAKSRNFAYIAKCARNYIPAATDGRGRYQIDAADTYETQLARPSAPPPLPLPHDDPWTIALRELLPTLNGAAQSYLTGSRLEAAGDVNGVPLHRVIVEPRAAIGVGWLTTQVGFAIRKRLGSLLGHPVLIEIVAGEPQPTP